ncbi:MAG: alkaline phosphatase family protein, partial [Bdellovibrionota bacterium]
SSILTTKPIGEQPITANKMVVNGETIDYESQLNRFGLWAAVDPLTVFEKLRKQGRTSASFSYVLGLNADDHVSVTLREGLEYQNNEYNKLDGRLLENLEEYLSTKGSRDWPAFIYVHLVGVDGTAHLYGAHSKQTKNYLNWLDKRLKNTFDILSKAETRKRVTTILTADHGFVDSTKFADVEKVIREKDSSIIVANENRFLGLYLQPGANRTEFERLLRHVRANPGVELIVERKNNRLRFSSQAQTLDFGYGPKVCTQARYSLALKPLPGQKLAAESFKCPEELNPAIQSYPFLVEGLSRYLNSPNHPDAVVIAKPDTAFTKEYKGNHGGPTADETLVPVLLRNASLAGLAIPHTSDLLKTLNSH